MKRNRQEGSTHVIIITVLTLALISAIGVLFWQNILNKPAKVASTVTASESPSALPTPSTKAYCAPIEKLCFDYPSNWSVAPVTVDPDVSGFQEQVVVSDQTGASWLQLQTGMGGLGGSCGNDDNSYSKILQTHTTKISGNYLVNEAAKDYMVNTAYAVSWMTYNGTDKNWTINMQLNDSKAAQNVGRIDLCDLGLGVLNGKNANAPGASEPGGVAFGYFKGDGPPATFSSEAEATAALSTVDVKKAYAILQSAYYK